MSEAQPRTYPVKDTNGFLGVRKVPNGLARLLASEPAHYWRVVHVPTDMGFTDFITKREAVDFAQRLYRALPESVWLGVNITKLGEATRAACEQKAGRWEVKGGSDE